MPSSRRFTARLVFGCSLMTSALVGCGDDPDSVPAARGFDTSRVVNVQSLSCTSRVVRGTAIRLADDIYLTAAHNVRDSRTVDVVTHADSIDSMTYVASDDRADLALLVADDGADLSTIDLDEWITNDPQRMAAIVTPTSTRSTAVGADVIVRATRPDGRQREWLGTSVLSALVAGESGSALVQDGAPIGLVVQAEKRAERGFAVSSAEVREFVAKVTSVQALPESHYPSGFTSDHEAGPVHLVGSTCP
ncbi:MAG: hypothetical protein RL550_1943 [Actinomycetota bacterium]